MVILLGATARADSAKVTYPPIPDWVRINDWNAISELPASDSSSDVRYLDYEAQDRPKQAEKFIRMVTYMANQTGVQNSGSLQIKFNAEYQDLRLHRVLIHRNGQTIDCLKPEKVRVIQPEDELSRDMLTGSQTAVLFIEDLRVGDILEYAYTIHGENPILAGHYANRFLIQSYWPFAYKQFRVIWDDPTPLQKRLHQTERAPVVNRWQQGWEYLWQLTNPPVVTFEDHQPEAYEPCPYVELSDFPTWQSVVTWALPLYQTSPTNLPPEMLDLLANWQKNAPSDEAKALLALDFVQNKLRYTGLELGVDSYRPTDPVETFQKRFGDCKGKAVLLGFLLQKLGIESHPALVNAYSHEAVKNWLPSPFAFNHVILQINLAGETCWVDPTLALQGGSLRSHYLPAYETALVLRPGSTNLENVPHSWAQLGVQQKVLANLWLGEFQQPATLILHTEYSGARADDIRYLLAGTDTNQLAKNHLNYYAKFYPGITSRIPPKITDDLANNLLTVDEMYAITNFWEHDTTAHRWLASFYAYSLRQALPEPTTRLRKTPLAVSFPMVYQHETIIHLRDKNWKIPNERTNIVNGAFSFQRSLSLNISGLDPTLSFRCECRTELASLPADKIPGYLSDVERMEKLLTESLQRPDQAAKKRLNIYMLMMALLGVIGTTVACVWYWHRSQASRPAMPPPLPLGQETQLVGLGGWLILVGINLGLAIPIRIYTILGHWSGYFSLQVWQLFTQPQSEYYHPIYAPLLTFEILGNIGILGLSILTFCLFIKKHRAFPRVFILLTIIRAIFLITDTIGCSVIPSLGSHSHNNDTKLITQTIGTIFGSLIWISYMLQSKRVKLTFTR